MGWGGAEGCGVGGGKGKGGAIYFKFILPYF